MFFKMGFLSKAPNKEERRLSTGWFFPSSHINKYLLYHMGISKSSLSGSKYLSCQGALKKKKVQENKRAIRFLKEKVCLYLHNNALRRIQT